MVIWVELVNGCLGCSSLRVLGVGKWMDEIMDC